MYLNEHYEKNIAIILISVFMTSCGILIPFPESKKYPTTFYVKNNSEKPINFQVSVIKRSSAEPFEMNNAFTVLPKDSILTRQVGYEKDTENPQKWFNKFTIFPVNGIKMNDPYKSENWAKGINNKGKPIYTFTIAE